MQEIEIYQVDAFSNKLFGGNPAAVCILETEIEASLMQKIATENNLAETAFVVPHEKFASIRYFTPLTEVDLCGHASLASAFVLSKFVQADRSLFKFETLRSGTISVEVRDDLFALNLPADELKDASPETDIIADILGVAPLELYRGRTDIMAVFEDSRIISQLKPDLNALAKIDCRGLIATAPGTKSDFVTRFFAPAIGVDEDPVTGSAHTTLVPYWAKKLGRTQLLSHQLSERGGELYCKELGDRTEVGGNAVLYLRGTIYI